MDDISNSICDVALRDDASKRLGQTVLSQAALNFKWGIPYKGRLASYIFKAQY